jgi:hypothetical protein
MLQSQQWGLSGSDTIAPGDYDGDAKSDFAVFRRTTGTWYILQSSNGQVRSELFGTNGDDAVPGDYDGDGKNDVAVSRNAGGSLVWYILGSSNGAVHTLQWGLNSDYEVPNYQTRP